jgi:hypothetical protein
MGLLPDLIRDAPDTEFAGYPASLKSGYRISGASRIPDIRRNVNSKFKCLVKYEINKDIKCIEGVFLYGKQK